MQPKTQPKTRHVTAWNSLLKGGRQHLLVPYTHAIMSEASKRCAAPVSLHLTNSGHLVEIDNLPDHA